VDQRRGGEAQESERRFEAAQADRMISGACVLAFDLCALARAISTAAEKPHARSGLALARSDPISIEDASQRVRSFARRMTGARMKG
jgi:hypothetical protein